MTLEKFENNDVGHVGEVEEEMIFFGYEAWPWNQAYKEFYSLSESRIGEHFLLPKLSQGLLKKYEDFKHYGGTLRDLHSGGPAVLFSSEERIELGKALVEMGTEIRSFTDRDLMGVSRNKYLQRVGEFAEILKRIRHSIEELKQLAEFEKDHPALHREIKERVKVFEYSLCYLGPEINHSTVHESLPFFKGRKEELNRLKAVLVVK